MTAITRDEKTRHGVEEVLQEETKATIQTKTGLVRKRGQSHHVRQIKVAPDKVQVEIQADPPEEKEAAKVEETKDARDAKYPSAPRDGF